MSVKLEKQDMGMWGEKFSVIVEKPNGLKFEVGIQEHQFEAIKKQLEFKLSTTSGQFQQNEIWS